MTVSLKGAYYLTSLGENNLMHILRLNPTSPAQPLIPIDL